MADEQFTLEGERFPLVEDTVVGTYSISVRWSGSKTYEVEAESEAQAIALATDKAEEGFDMADASEVSSAEVEWFDPAYDESNPHARTAEDWASRIVGDLRESGLARTPIAGGAVELALGSPLPKKVMDALRSRKDARTEDEAGTTYLVLV